MTFDWTINLTTIAIAMVSVIVVPGLRAVHGMLRANEVTLKNITDTLAQLTFIVVGPDKDHSTGLVADVSALKKESQRHRNWLIEIQAERGLRLDDRS